MHTGRSLIGLTSVTASQATVTVLNQIRKCGCVPIVISHAANTERMEELLPKEDVDNAVIVQSFENPQLAAQMAAQLLQKRQIKLRNWINITDDVSAFYIRACQLLELRAEFLTTYVRSRAKILARRIAKRRGLCDTKFTLHDIKRVHMPKGFLFPFVVKPILGTGSRGVRIIRSSTDWHEYLEQARSALRHDAISIGGIRPGEQVIVEEIIAGQEFQVDGFVEGGNVQICAIGMKTCKYEHDAFRETHGVLYRPLVLKDARRHDEAIMRWCTHLVQAIGYRAGTFHIEMKVNGPDIHLIEINPRPGGGGNVPVIKQLSGFDLHSECVRLWCGMGRQETSKAIHKSTSFAVRYPLGRGARKQSGNVSFVRRAGTIDRKLSIGKCRLRWMPLTEYGDEICLDDREQYLGVLTGNDLGTALGSLDGLSQELAAIINGNGFVRESW